MIIIDFIAYGLLVHALMLMVVLYLKTRAKGSASESRLQKLPADVKAELRSVRGVILNQDIDDVLDRQCRAKIDEDLRQKATELRNRQYRALLGTGPEKRSARH